MRWIVIIPIWFIVIVLFAVARCWLPFAREPENV